MNENLSAIQIEALNSLYESFRTNINPICAVGTGSGKTRIACNVIEKVIISNPNFRILIIHKASNYTDPWIKELELNNLVMTNNNSNIKSGYIYLHGKKREKYIFGNNYIFQKHTIFLTSYETLRLDMEKGNYDLDNIFDLIIYDELHNIINFSRLTKKSMSIYSLKGKWKLALTASPINNNENEISLLYAFLNDNVGFGKIVNYYSNFNDNDENSEIYINIGKTLLEYKQLSIKNNFIFYFYEKKEGFNKISIILSIPIDENMLIEAKEISKSITPDQRKFLSHPASLYKDIDRIELPCCTKEIAIRVILESMLNNEKAIIFSQFIDVLNVYAEICEQFGFPSIIITGNDKGQILKNKLEEFKSTSIIKVLLTTLQKSAEGFNFPFATHIIILELWWNPQKIIQAMSRIDRKTQTRNIFIYLLCYNYNEEMIKQERVFYDKMVEKLNKANNYLKEIDIMHPKMNPNLKTEYIKLPEIKEFFIIKDLEYELKNYINQFQHTEKSEYSYSYYEGNPLGQTKKTLLFEGNYDLKIFNSLENTPWRIHDEDIVEFMNDFYKIKLHENIKLLFNEETDDIIAKYRFNKKLIDYYQFIFFDIVTYKIILFNGNKINIRLFILIGKRKTGQLDFIGVYYNKNFDISYIFMDLKNRGVRRIKLILTYINLSTHIKNILPKYFPKTICQVCFISLIHRSTSSKTIEPKQKDLIDQVFTSNTYNKAMKVCEKSGNAGFENDFILRRLYRNLLYDKKLFIYKHENRKVICTLNIITYLNNYISILIDKKVFTTIPEAITFISIISEKILQNGDFFIPNWDTLIKPIDQ